MSVWRYTAVDTRDARNGRRSGELAGATAAEVRASLRRIGLQVIDLKPIASGRGAAGAAATGLGALMRPHVNRHLRTRRREARAELYDSLATMLISGVPLLEAFDTVIGATEGRRSPQRLMLVSIRQDLRSGSSLHDAMKGQPAWFDATEVAMVEAGQHSGTLPDVLRGLADRHQRAGELGQKLAGAMAYPAVVAVVGVGVVIFLSVKTLPSLTGVLADAGIEAPSLTRVVMSIGQGLARWWYLFVAAVPALAAAAILGAALAGRWGIQPPQAVRRLKPKVFRRIAVSRLALQLSEMVRTGVPMVDALRVLAPTVGGGLRQRLVAAASQVEHGEELSAALDDDLWFDAEFRRLLDVGQATGELESLLQRIGERYARQSARLIDRLTTLMEPCVILTLAALVGTVVVAAILPLLRLQEIL